MCSSHWQGFRPIERIRGWAATWKSAKCVGFYAVLFFPLAAGVVAGAKSQLQPNYCCGANRGLSSLGHPSMSWACKPVLMVTLTTFLLLLSSCSHSLPGPGSWPKQ